LHYPSSISVPTMRPLPCQNMLGRKLARCGLYAKVVSLLM
jgi:hypothetical protein